MVRLGEPARLLLHEPRNANILLGFWLFVSAFAWPHALDERMAEGILGLMVMVLGAGTIFEDELHYVEAMLASLLGIAAFVVPHLSRVSAFNEGIVALAVLVLSFVHRSTQAGPFLQPKPPRAV